MNLRTFVLICITSMGLTLGLSRSLAAEEAATTTAPANVEAATEPAHPAVTTHAAETAHTSAPAGHEAGAAHTENPIPPELNPITLIATIAIFVMLLIVLRFTAWKPIMAGLQSREQAIRDSIEAAERARAEADRTTHELEAKMAEVQRQAADQLAQAKVDAVKVADTIRAQAEAESTALKDRTVRDIDAAKQQALSEINAYAAILGTAVAKKILQREVNTTDQQRLVDESLSELAKKN